VLIASAGLFIVTNRQPQQEAFALLAEPPTSEAEANTLLERSDSIRLGLLNAYLAPFRYVSAHGEVRHITDLYANSFDIPRRDAFKVQGLYENLPARCYTSQCTSRSLLLGRITTP